MRPFKLIFMLLVLGNVSISLAAGRWEAPPASPVPAQLPRFDRAPVVDGVLDEWSSAAGVPVRSRSYITIRAKGRAWNGHSDAGAEFYCAWSEKGLCVAAVVADDEVINDLQGANIWQKDCVEVFVDARSDASFMKSPYSKSAYQILVRPPVSGQPAAAVTNPRDGNIAGIEVAGVRNAGGYTIEMLIPWSAAPNFTPAPGARIGLQFSLDDYDSRDGVLTQPLQLTYLGTPDVWIKPENFVQWTLVDDVQTGPREYLGPMVVLDLPTLGNTLKPVLFAAEFAAPLTPHVAAVRFEAHDHEGNRVLDRKAPVWRMNRPWQMCGMTRLSWDASELADGYYSITVTALDTSGRALGFATRPVLLAGNTILTALRKIGSADLPALSQSRPFEAAAYLGAGACAEKFRWLMDNFKVQEMVRAARELELRFDVLEDGKLDDPAPGFFDLLALAGRPESQVVVEYPAPNQAGVTFNWGSVPMLVARVFQMSPADAESKAKNVAPGQAKIAKGDRLIEVTSASSEAALRAAQLVAAGKPIQPEDVDAIRRDIVKALSARITRNAPTEVPFCGDLHMHTSYSDGRCTPAGLMLQAMYAGLDYAVISDHNTIEGAQMIQRVLNEKGFAYPCIVGEEITAEWSHFNAYPLHEVIRWDIPTDEMIEAAHSQGAVIQWNHPHAVISDWMKAHFNTDIRKIGMDAWEHVPADYEKRKAEGILGVLVGSTDTHHGVFESGERTLVFSNVADGDDVADAVRAGKVIAVAPALGGLFYGSDDLVAAAVGALAEGSKLKAAKEERLRAVLKNADVPGLLLAD